MKCYRCIAKIAYDGGPHENEANAGCDSQFKLFMDDNYRSPNECGPNEICYASLMQGTKPGQANYKYCKLTEYLFISHRKVQWPTGNV